MVLQFGGDKAQVPAAVGIFHSFQIDAHDFSPVKEKIGGSGISVNDYFGIQATISRLFHQWSGRLFQASCFRGTQDFLSRETRILSKYHCERDGGNRNGRAAVAVKRVKNLAR